MGELFTEDEIKANVEQQMAINRISTIKHYVEGLTFELSNNIKNIFLWFNRRHSEIVEKINKENTELKEEIKKYKELHKEAHHIGDLKEMIQNNDYLKLGEVCKILQSKLISLEEKLFQFESMSQEMNTQDNRITSHPLWVVYDRKNIPVGDDYCHEYIYLDHYDHGEYKGSIEGLKQYAEENGYIMPDNLEHEEDIFEYLKNYQKGNGFTKEWIKEIKEFKEVFFTEKSAKIYIERNRHNLTKPYDYVMSLYYNPEMQKVREFFLELKSFKKEIMEEK